MMRMFRGLLALSVLPLALAAGEAAAEPRPGPYIGLLAIGANGTVGHSMLGRTDFNNFALPAVSQRTDDVAALGLQGGWRFSNLPIRLELEAHYRFRFDNNVADLVDPNTGRRAVYHSNIASLVILANAIYEFRNRSRFTPFAGVSAGFARHMNEATRYDVGGPMPNGTNRDADTNNFAYGIMAGVEWAFATSWSTSFTYRLINLGETETGQFPGGQSVRNKSYGSQDLMLTLQYHF